MHGESEQIRELISPLVPKPQRAQDSEIEYLTDPE